MTHPRLHAEHSVELGSPRAADSGCALATKLHALWAGASTPPSPHLLPPAFLPTCISRAPTLGGSLCRVYILEQGLLTVAVPWTPLTSGPLLRIPFVNLHNKIG